jgi:hypothetical protein
VSLQGCEVPASKPAFPFFEGDLIQSCIEVIDV